MSDEQLIQPAASPKTADDILNELFNELGSKPLNDTDEPSSKSKKKKKHKEKEKVKVKGKSKSGSKKSKDKHEDVNEESSSKSNNDNKEKKKHKQKEGKKKTEKLLKKSTSHNEDEVDNVESIPKSKKRKLDKSPSPEDSHHHHRHKSSDKIKSSSKSNKGKKESEIDLEEGEILEKEKKHKKSKDNHHHHEEKSSKHHHSKSHRRHSADNYEDINNDYLPPPPSLPSDVTDRSHHHHHHYEKHSSHSKNSDYNRDSNRDEHRPRTPDYILRDGSSRHQSEHRSDRYENDDYKSPDDRYSSSSKPYKHVDDRSSDFRYSDERGRYKDRDNSYRDSSDYRRSNSSSSYQRNSFPYSGSNNNNNYSYRPSYRSDRFSRRSRSRSRSRGRSRHPADIIDKAKLLEIARRNATLLMKQGVLPTDIFSRDQIMAIKAGGKSVEELTSYCRKLARKDSGLDDGSGGEGGSDGGGEEEHFIHHPFVVKERPMPQITLNIRNAIPLPVRTPQELAIENVMRRSQFPVSSGCQHRFKELEWKVVDKDDDKEKKPKEDNSKALVPLPSSSTTTTQPPIGTATPIIKADTTKGDNSPDNINLDASKKDSNDTGISLDPMLPQVDISSVISARLKAMRTLKENPESEEAKKMLDSAVVEMNQWAQAKALEPKFLTVSELQTGPQAWAKRDQLKNAKEVASGMGMHLLQKMGWRPGEGLGKNKEGTTEPLALDVKTDKKGLMSQADLKQKGPQANVSMLYDLAGKHPVSALMELCTKRRWGPPVFELCFEHGPAHQRQFVYKVVVNGVEYQPCIATNNKKLAKANAAAFCLQSLGLLKTNTPAGATENLQTVPATAPTVVEPSGPPASFVSSSSFLQTVPTGVNPPNP